MASLPIESTWSHAAPDLLSQASSVLAREVARFPNGLLGVPAQRPSTAVSPFPDVGAELLGLAGRTCPITGAAVPSGGADKDRLRQQAHEIVATLLATMGPALGKGGAAPSARDLASAAPAFPPGLPKPADATCPVTRATVPAGGFDLDRLRRQAHEFIETLLITFNDATGEKGLPAEDQVPLVQGMAPVQPGSSGRATLRVANEEGSPSSVALYCTNFVADSGYEIPSSRVTVSPRSVIIPAKGDAVFEITIAVSQQTPAGTYSGLIQAMGSKYVKAVLSVEVL